MLTLIATTSVIISAAYLLWAIQRILFNSLDKPENATLRDLSARELVVLLPLVAGIVWLGLFPGPVLQRIEPAARRYIETVRGPMAALEMSQRIPGARP